MQTKSIEQFFLNTLLKISIGGVTLILLSDVFLYPDDRLSIAIDSAVLAAGITSFLLRNRFQSLSVLMLTSVVLAAMVYQCLNVPMSTTNSLSIILLVGFLHSVMLNGRLLLLAQIVTITVVNVIFIIQFTTPGMTYTTQRNEMITVNITYSIIFFILTYATATLKASYDRINQNLHESNRELNQKASEIESQNEELLQMQDKMNVLNTDLEKLVRERTAKIRLQNEVLLKYSYTNAHHLRGPVARLLGLASIYHLDPNQDPMFIIDKMVQQAYEIDDVIQQINVDLETGHAGEFSQEVGAGV